MYYKVNIPNKINVVISPNGYGKFYHEFKRYRDSVRKEIIKYGLNCSSTEQKKAVSDILRIITRKDFEFNEKR